MSTLRAFLQYAQAFELAYLSDDWSIIAPFFAEGARHVVTRGGPHDRDDRGRDAVVQGFRQAVHDHDRRFDLRLPEILEGPVARDGASGCGFASPRVTRGCPTSPSRGSI